MVLVWRRSAVLNAFVATTKSGGISKAFFLSLVINSFFVLMFTLNGYPRSLFSISHFHPLHDLVYPEIWIEALELNFNIGCSMTLFLPLCLTSLVESESFNRVDATLPLGRYYLLGALLIISATAGSPMPNERAFIQ